MMTDRYSVNPGGVYCVYINNIFKNDGDNRRTENDTKIKEVFEKQLGFTVDYHEEKSASEMESILQDIPQKYTNELSCLIIILSSHGKDGHIEGIKDKGFKKRLYYKDINEVLIHENLKGIPKVLCINACRDQNKPFDELKQFTAPDTLIINSCCSGDKAHRTSFTGALFIEALCSVFEKNFNVDISVLANTIQNELYTLKSEQTICCWSSLSKKLIIRGVKGAVE
ncbi:caspase-14-like [Argonauta hians]